MERLFARLSAIYGNRMTTMWGDCPKADIMDAWRDGLRGFSAERIKYGLEHVARQHPQWPPTLGEFMEVCGPAAITLAHRPYLPAPKDEPIDPVVEAMVKNAFAKIEKRDPKDWARHLIARMECGEKLLPIQIEGAKRALGLSAIRKRPPEYRAAEIVALSL
jgi:hypothetical protein